MPLFAGTRLVVTQSVVSGDRHLLVESGRDARYVPTGHLVYGLASALHAVLSATEVLGPT